MKTKIVDIVSLVEDLELWPREKIDGSHIKMMVQSIKAGVEMPPIRISETGNIIIDGFHRVRAYKKLKKVAILAEVKKYATRAEMLLDSIAMNSRHGRKLTYYDQARCILKATEQGIPDETLAVALGITFDRILELRIERFAQYKAEIIPLRKTAIHLAGLKLTKSQFEYTQKTGGMTQLFYINQVVSMLELDSVDWDNERTVSKLHKLLELLQKKIK